MWNDQFLFVWASLTGIGLWLVFYQRRYGRNSGTPPVPAPVTGVMTWLRNWIGNPSRGFAATYPIWLLAIISGSILVLHTLAYWLRAEHFLPEVGVAATVLLGLVFGFFSAQFVARTFRRDFRLRYALIGVGSVFVLSVAYSLPVYHKEVTSLLKGIGLTSLKTGVVELTFAEHTQQPRAAVQSASSAGSGGTAATGVPHPSDPEHALKWLSRQVSDDNATTYIQADRKYISDFERGYLTDHSVKDRTDWAFQEAVYFLRPVKILSDCPTDYVFVVRDSQLLLVNIKPVIEELLKVHAHARQRLDPCFRGDKKCSPELADYDSDPASQEQEWKDLNAAVRKVLSEITTDFPHEVDVSKCSPKRIDEISSDRALPLAYLQPYVTIALASLLWAHGSPDEGVDVLAQWLDMWSCARGTSGGRGGCPAGRVRDAEKLPEWFALRAEFELVAATWRVAGYSNINFRDLAAGHQDRFMQFVRKSAPHMSLDTELDACNAAVRAGASRPAQTTKTQVLDLLLSDLDTKLRAETFFVSDKQMPELENLDDQAVTLASFKPQCFPPPDAEHPDRYKGILASYQITAGLLSLAIAERIERIAASADERHKGTEIFENAKATLRNGFRALKELRDPKREELAGKPWAVRLFEVPEWEEAYGLAVRAIDQLNASEQ